MSNNIPLSFAPNKPCCTPTRQGDSALPATASPVCSSRSGSTRGMVQLSGGSFLMGSESAKARAGDGEAPVRRVEVRPFFLDACAVTNARFEEFVRVTGYVSEAERFGWSYVFHRHVNAQNKKLVRGVSDGASWWLGIDGACWRKPEGAGSDIQKRGEHPVVHVSWNDAQQFCAWAKLRLPSETEWEYAARGGLVQKQFPWGDELTPRGKNGGEHRCNIWQGKFPDLDTGADGFTATAPVKTYATNNFGLYQMSGNVWEWCADLFAKAETHRVVRGGSFLCHASYCNRYRVAARTANTPDSTTSHTGFRCARDE